MRYAITLFFIVFLMSGGIALGADKFVPGEWRYLAEPKPGANDKVIVVREYAGSLRSCVINFFILAQDIGGERAVLDKPARLEASPLYSRYVYLNGIEIADIGCNKGLQTVTARPDIARKLVGR